MAAPTITTQAADTQVLQGSNAQFAVIAAGTDLSYQWQRSSDAGLSWAAIDGASSASLRLVAVMSSDSGSLFRVIVSNNGLQTVGAAATLTVTTAIVPPSITVQPAAQQATEGGAANFAVTATGSSLVYQWQGSTDGVTWTDIGGATQPTLQLSALTLASNGMRYRVRLGNAVAQLASDGAALTVQAAPATPVFATQPASTAVTAPAPAVFSVTVSGNLTLDLQWQRSSDNGMNFSDIAGATLASYTTPATALADSGTLIRVRARNASGTTLSDAATLSVSATPTPPSLQREPQDTSVGVNQVATFAVEASGTPQPGYQWQLSSDGGATWANINGANAASYSLTAAAVDHGRRLRVTVSNSQGTVTSRGALLSIAAGVMSGRDWATAQSLEDNSSAQPVLNPVSTIDDAGRVTVLFLKNDGNRNVLYATRGLPNGAGTAPTWTTPVPIDVQGAAAVNFTSSTNEVSVTAAPGGDVVALWGQFTTCTTTTYLGTGALFCAYYYYSTYRIATNTWDAPAMVTDTPYGAFKTYVNDRGDVVFFGDSWVPYGNLRYTAIKALFMKAAGETSFRRQLPTNDPTQPFATIQLDMDGAGNLLLTTKAVVNGTTEIRAARGTVAGGLGTPFLLNTQAAPVLYLEHTRLGLNGQQVVVWQDDFLNVFAATSANASDGFVVGNLGQGPSTGSLSVSDTGRAMLCSAGCTKRQVWTTATGWGPMESTGSLMLIYGGNLSQVAVSRNGDQLWADAFFGASATYDAGLNRAVIATSNVALSQHYVLGLSSPVNYIKPLLSISGIGFVTMLNGYDALPTPAAPAGVVHAGGTASDATALWGAFLK